MIHEYKITKVFITDKKKDGTAITSFGKPAKKVCIKLNWPQTGDNWVYSYPTSKTDDPILTLKEGDSKRLIIWQKDSWWNFKLPSKSDELEDLISKLEVRVSQLEKDVYEEEPQKSAVKGEAKPEFDQTELGALEEEVRPEDLPF